MTYRLLKVVCQPVLVTEGEDGNLIEHNVQPINVPAADWPNFSQALLAQIAQLNNGQIQPERINADVS